MHGSGCPKKKKKKRDYGQSLFEQFNNFYQTWVCHTQQHGEELTTNWTEKKDKKSLVEHENGVITYQAISCSFPNLVAVTLLEKGKTLWKYYPRKFL